MKLRNKRFFFRNKTFIVLFSFLLLFGILFYRITYNASLYLLNYAEAETSKLVTVVINSSVSKKTLEGLDSNSLFFVTKNGNDEIEMIDYNSIMVNNFLDKITNEVQDNLLKMENGHLSLNDELNTDSGVAFYIPLGILLNNPLFNYLGPNIPVKLKAIGSLNTNINVRIKEYGINNAFIEMAVFIEIRERIILPLISKNIVITNEVPVSYKLINGKIPNYYGNSGITKSSNIYSISLE